MLWFNTNQIRRYSFFKVRYRQNLRKSDCLLAYKFFFILLVLKHHVDTLGGAGSVSGVELAVFHSRILAVIISPYNYDLYISKG